MKYLMLTLSIGVLTGIGYAETDATPAAPGRFGALFKQADANNDRQVTFEEATAAFPQVTREQFDRYDRNGDGKITPADRPAGASGGDRGVMGRVAQADADGDDKVTYEELRAIAPNIPEERFKHFDRNGDGVLSKADAPKKPSRPGEPGAKAGRMALLKKADSNGDKRITFEELHAVAPAIPRERFDKMDRNNDGVLSPADAPEGPPVNAEGAKPRGPQTPAGRRPQQNHMAMLRKADANHDREVTYEELTAVKPDFPRGAFDRLDKDGDGILTPADRPASRQGRPEGRQGMLGKLQQADADGNGEISYEEVTAAKPGFPREAFDRLDRNNDGVISKDDAPKSK